MASQANDAVGRVALVIEDTIHRYAVEGMLHSVPGLDTVRAGHDGGSGSGPHGGHPIDVVLAAAGDLAAEPMLGAVRAVCARGARLVLLVDGPEAAEVPRLGSCAVHGFLDWAELDPRTLADAVADVLAGKFAVSAGLARRLISREAVEGRPAPAAAPGALRGPAGVALTPRELQVLRLLAEGLSNKQVSHRLLISEHGVKRLVGNVLAKLNCPNRTLAVVRAMDDGLLAI
ncbi:response regulator transcription factor [Streptomyces sp. NPDC005827]|uniref:helix-turn-helix transcriptional regulator n=1 Tax=Streptomyces sp. NPDC005827 TaxID=3157070 RepID=UPI0034005612